MLICLTYERRAGQSVYGMTKSALDLPDPDPGRGAGPARRPGQRHLPRADTYRWLGSQVPLGRIGAPEEVALWITLLSPVASFMTGAVIPLDGRQVIDRE
jgi:NAD(P)-dependent dehydrogenase (short-subunit alcohol dehydrogenase family)